MARSRHTLRLATSDDVEPVAALMREAGFKARSSAGWRWLFVDNPAHQRPEPPPMGWVLEGSDGQLQGYLGNILLRYVLDGQPLSAATCTSYYVRPEARADSVSLLRAFFKQKGVALFLSTTANPASDPLYRMFKAEPPVDASFSEGYAWVASDRRAIQAVLSRRGTHPMLARAVSHAAAPVARATRRLSGFARIPHHPDTEAVAVLQPADVDEWFDKLWALRAAQPGLQVQRDAASLRWYLRDPDAGDAVVLALSDQDGLRGYVAAAPHAPGGTGATELRILDVAIRPGDTGAIAPLLRRAVLHARSVGAGLIYAAPCGAALAAELTALRPHRHGHAHAAHFLRARKRAETGRYTGPGVWLATGLDGDTPFCIERVDPTRG